MPARTPGGTPPSLPSPAIEHPGIRARGNGDTRRGKGSRQGHVRGSPPERQPPGGMRRTAAGRGQERLAEGGLPPADPGAFDLRRGRSDPPRRRMADRGDLCGDAAARRDRRVLGRPTPEDDIRPSAGPSMSRRPILRARRKSVPGKMGVRRTRHLGKRMDAWQWWSLASPWS